jgi:hypothetical protein
MSLWYVVRLNTYLDLVSYLKDSKIWFNCKSNLTSAIGIFSKSQHLASYVSRHNAMAYDNVMLSTLKDAPPPTSISQMEAIANLRDLFESWHSLGPPPTAYSHVLAPRHPRVAIKLPRVATPLLPTVAATPAPAWTPPP